MSRTDAIGIPGDLDYLEQQHQPPPEPQRVKEERAVVWNRLMPDYLRSRPCTLRDMEEFLMDARQAGAPDNALLFAMPDLVRCGWYA